MEPTQQSQLQVFQFRPNSHNVKCGSDAHCTALA